VSLHSRVSLEQLITCTVRLGVRAPEPLRRQSRVLRCLLKIDSAAGECLLHIGREVEDQQVLPEELLRDTRHDV
jgi:hypothetical protein